MSRKRSRGVREKDVGSYSRFPSCETVDIREVCETVVVCASLTSRILNKSPAWSGRDFRPLTFKDDVETRARRHELPINFRQLLPLHLLVPGRATKGIDQSVKALVDAALPERAYLRLRKYSSDTLTAGKSTRRYNLREKRGKGITGFGNIFKGIGNPISRFPYIKSFSRAQQRVE